MHVSCAPQSRRELIPAGAEDADVVRLLGTPAQVGGKSVWVSEQCVRRHRARRRSSRKPWHVRLLLRQLLETGRYRRSRPAWVPAEIASFDGYVELKDGEEVVGLSRDPNDPRTFRAVTWFERDCLDWEVLPDEAAPRQGALRVELSAHCVERYQERVVGGGTLAAAREELVAVVQAGRLLPEVPTWCVEHARGGLPAYWLIVDDWLVLPLEPTNRPVGDVLPRRHLPLSGDGRGQACSAAVRAAVRREAAAPSRIASRARGRSTRCARPHSRHLPSDLTRHHAISRMPRFLRPPLATPVAFALATLAVVFASLRLVGARDVAARPRRRHLRRLPQPGRRPARRRHPRPRRRRRLLRDLPCPCAGPGRRRRRPPPAPAAPAPSERSCTRPAGVQPISFSKTKYPHIRRHFRAALRRGWPRTLVLNRPGADARRERLLADIPTRDGFDRDEYPPAVGRGKRQGPRARPPPARLEGRRRATSPARRTARTARRSGIKLRRFCDGTRFRYVFY